MVELPTWLTALCNLNQGLSYPKPVTDAQLVLGQPRCTDIFAKGASVIEFRIRKTFRCKMGNPFGIMFGRIKMHRLINAAMHRWVGHLITLKPHFA